MNGVPEWFQCLSQLGRAAASQHNRTIGEDYPVTVLSVPTGQFAVWALLNGAFEAAPKISAPTSFPSTCVAWNKDSKQVDDVLVERTEHGGSPAIKIGQMTYLNPIPLTQLPDGVSPRPGKVLRVAERNVIKAEFERLNIATPSKHWYLPWTEQCLSPIVIVGDGQEYLLEQLDELRNDPRAESWLTPLARTLSSFSSGKVTDPEHILRLPFSILSQQATTQNRWINQLKPRLVIYTRWSYFKRRPATAFSGVPTVVLTNRRVDSTVTAAYETKNIHRQHPDWLRGLTFPRGIACRYLEYPALEFQESAIDPDFLDEDDF